jgi:hypothetical protein
VRNGVAILSGKKRIWAQSCCSPQYYNTIQRGETVVHAKHLKKISVVKIALE